jgi:hypothetical protein
VVILGPIFPYRNHLKKETNQEKHKEQHLKPSSQGQEGVSGISYSQPSFVEFSPIWEGISTVIS